MTKSLSQQSPRPKTERRIPNYPRHGVAGLIVLFAACAGASCESEELGVSPVSPAGDLPSHFVLDAGNDATDTGAGGNTQDGGDAGLPGTGGAEGGVAPYPFEDAGHPTDAGNAGDAGDGGQDARPDQDAGGSGGFGGGDMAGGVAHPYEPGTDGG